MTKQVLEIEVPEGKKAVWKDDRVVFENVVTMEDIKTIDDAIQFLSDKGICKDILDSLSRLPKNSFEWKVAAYRAVVAAVTDNEKRHLTRGGHWFPTIEFCYPGKLKTCGSNIILGKIKSEGEEFDIVSGYATRGTFAGLGYFNTFTGMSIAQPIVSFRSVGSEEVALYISKQFGKLLFEISYGGTNCDWEWIE